MLATQGDQAKLLTWLDGGGEVNAPRPSPPANGRQSSAVCGDAAAETGASHHTERRATM